MYGVYIKKAQGYGYKMERVFTIEKIDGAEIAQGLKENGFEPIPGRNAYAQTREITRGEYTYKVNGPEIPVDAMYIGVEMPYKNYKDNYTSCETEKDSYNKKEKTIVVFINVLTGDFSRI